MLRGSKNSENSWEQSCQLRYTKTRGYTLFTTTSNLLKQLKKVLQSPGSPKKKAQAKSTREEAECIHRTQHKEAIQRSRSSLPSIQAQSSEADERLLYLD